MGMYRNDSMQYVVLGIGEHKSKDGSKQYYDLSLQLDNDNCNRSGTWAITRTIGRDQFLQMLSRENISLQALKGKKIRIYEQYNNGVDGRPGYYTVTDLREVK